MSQGNNKDRLLHEKVALAAYDAKKDRYNSKVSEENFNYALRYVGPHLTTSQTAAAALKKPFIDAAAIDSSENIGKYLRAKATLVGYSESSFIRYENWDHSQKIQINELECLIGDRTVSLLSLQDTTDVTKDILTKTVNAEIIFQPLELYGRVLYLCKSVRALDKLAGLLGDEETIESTFKAIKKKILSSKKTALDYIADEFISTRGAVVKKNSPMYHVFKSVILQAASHKSFGARNSKPSISVIGPSGIGKSLSADLAKAINPVFEIAHPAKLTATGLNGAVTSSGSSYSATPGLLAKAHGGVLSLQEYQDVLKKGDFHAALVSALEEGVVRNSNASQKTFPANTGVLIDMNLQSQVRARNTDTDSGLITLEDVGLDLHIINRMAFIFMLEADENDLINNALERIDGTHTDCDFIGQMQDFKILIAKLLDDPLDVDFPGELRSGLKAELDSMFSHDRQKMAPFAQRIVQMALPLIRTNAHINFRKEVSSDDIEEVMELLSYKIDFLTSLKSQSKANTPFALGSNKARKKKVIEIISQELTTFTHQEAANLLEKHGLIIPSGTLTRYLQQSFVSAGYAKYKVSKEK